MKTLIIGGGVVGYNIASRLVEEGHDVTVVDADPSALERIDSHLDVSIIRGFGSRPDVLADADVKNVEMVVAVTNSDEVNMVACMNAGLMSQASVVKVARVRDPSYTDDQFLADDTYGIDLMLNPEQVTADRIASLLRYPGITDVSDFADGKVKLIGIRISPTSPFSGLRLMELRQRFPDSGFIVGAVVRSGDVIIPRGETVILPGDEVYLVTAIEDVDDALASAGLVTNPVRRVMILGGGRIGEFLALGLESRGIKPKIIEPDRERAVTLADRLPETTVIHGSPTDADLLMEENAGEMQAVVICSASEETNLMAALLAHQMGPSRIIAITNVVEYRTLIKTVGIDACLSPRLIAVSSILRFIRKGRVVAVQALGDGDAAEVLEFEAQLSSEAVGRALRDIRVPRGALIAAIVREETVLIPRGTTVIEEGDHIVVLAQKDAVGRVSQLLRSQEAGS